MARKTFPKGGKSAQKTTLRLLTLSRDKATPRGKLRKPRTGLMFEHQTHEASPKAREPQLRILQLNMGRAKVVSDELRRAIVEHKYDFALGQELYAWRGKIPGMGLDIAIVMGAKGKETPAAAILYTRAEYTVTKITQLCTSHCVCIQVGGEFGDIYLVSLYC